ncbi:MAG TPA: hypothetical protein VJV78_43120 [Polyangiales bacterium]|nr:hypothetical protein [Polyangiales bacterium]
MRWSWVACAAQSSVAWAANAWACPSCPIGRAARQQVWQQDFGQHALFALVPFLVVGVAAMWAERIGKH